VFFLFKDDTMKNIFILYSILITSHLYSQTSSEMDLFYSIYDQFTGVENVELNNGSGHLAQYRVYDKSHFFLNTNNYVEGSITYNLQPYKAVLKYDILNDLIVVKYIDKNSAFAINLNSTLVDRFKFAKRSFERLKINKTIEPIYKNGFFEKHFDGKQYKLWEKHIKHKKSKNMNNTVYYRFEKESILILEYKNSFYIIKNKRRLKKILPVYKKQITDFFNNKKVKFNATNLKKFLKIIEKPYN
jgi:hypothetical protein